MRRNLQRRAGLALFTLFAAFAQSKDPLVGTWHLNRGKSEFQPESTMQSRTLTIEAKGNGIGVSQQTVAQDGHSVYVDYTANYDSKDVPISGSPLDTVALKRVDARTVERTGKIHGQVIETATMTLSADGKILTIITKGSVNDNDYGSTQVFERQ